MKLTIDRDINGARNNGLRALADGGFGRFTRADDAGAAF
jgi:transposase|tara:strand:+ start:4903 stop:5019 length:117 start_codon:yes stop_codon:yes gene_type:complete